VQEYTYCLLVCMNTRVIFRGATSAGFASCNSYVPFSLWNGSQDQAVILYGSFQDADAISEYVASNGRAICE
jgi:hypothetical protein